MKRLTWELMDILVFPPACHKQPPWGFHVGCIHCISLNLLLAFPTISPQFLSKKPMLYPCCTVLGWVVLNWDEFYNGVIFNASTNSPNLFSIRFLWYWWGDFVQPFTASLTRNHFLHLHDLNVWSSNKTPRK